VSPANPAIPPGVNSMPCSRLHRRLGTLLLTRKIGPFVLFSIRGSSDGGGMIRNAGSRMHVLDWVEKPKDEFLASLNTLLTGTGASVCSADHWRPIDRLDASVLRLTRVDPSMVSV